MLNKLKIRIQNYKSYLDSGWISLDGKNILVGVDHRGYSNGSGKSTILDALTLFLDNNWENYTKTEVGILTNINTPKKQYAVITINCILDGEEFEAIIEGKDGFTFYGDKFKLFKFQQEMSGSIMTQGLINNLADFDKRSQLDSYIDQFYKVQEVIVKLKDFKDEVVSNLNNKLSNINTSINAELNNINILEKQEYTYKGQLDLYKEFAEEDTNKLLVEYNNVDAKVSSIEDMFSYKKDNLQKERNVINNRIVELSNVELLKQKIEKIKNEREQYINGEKTKFLSSCSKTINTFISTYIEDVQYLYYLQYNKEVEAKKRDRQNKINDIQDKINMLSLKTPDYVLTEKEILEVNNSVKEWVPQGFKLGDTYKTVIDSLNWFVTEVKKVIEEDSEEVVKLREELNNIPTVTYVKTALQKRAEELTIDSSNKKYAPVNYPKYYLYWDYIEETGEFKYDYNLPTEFEKEINPSDIKLGKLSYDTSFYDSRILELEQELSKDSFEELKNLNARVKEIDSSLKELSEKELEYQKYLNFKQDIKRKLTGADNYNKLVASIKEVESKIENNKVSYNNLIEEKDIYQKRLEDMNKLIDSVCKYSGEELRNEFGFKLSRLASILLNDIFNLEGEITLESNGSRTTFKYNDGNGFLSFKVLSGGQLQKIKLSINLALLLFFYKDRQYIFLDEVFQHLDNPSKALLINYIVKELKIKNILLIQHDSLKFEGFKEIRIYRDENKNTKVVE